MQLVPKVVDLLNGKSSLQKGARIDTGGSVSLKIDQVPRVLLTLAAEEVIEPDFIQVRSRSIGSDMPPDAFFFAVRTHNHCHGIPTHDRTNTPFQLFVARVRRLIPDGNRIDVGRVRREGQIHSLGLGITGQLSKQRTHTRGTFPVQNLLQGFQPFPSFQCVLSNLFHVICVFHVSIHHELCIFFKKSSANSYDTNRYHSRGKMTRGP